MKLVDSYRNIELPDGIWQMRNIKYSEVFNPITNGHCVLMCLKNVFDFDSFRQIETTSSIAVTNMFKPGVTENELRDGLLSIGINFMLIKTSTGKLFKLFNAPTICLNIGEVGIVKHCSVVSVIGLDEQYSLMSQPLTTNIRDNDLNEHIIQMQNTFSISELCDPIIMMSKFGNKFVKNFHARMRSISLHSMSSRQELHMTTTELNKTNSVHFGITHHRDKSLSIGVVNTKHGWVNVNYEIYKSNLLIYSDIPCENPCFIINLHLTYPLTRNVRSVTDKSISWLCLNKATVKFCERNKPLIRSNSIVTNYSSDYNLIVADYDNRSHHNYDEEGYIKLAKTVKMYCIPSITPPDLFVTHNRCYNRLCVRMGTKYYAHECELDSTVKLIQYYEKCLIEGNTVYTE